MITNKNKLFFLLAYITMGILNMEAQEKNLAQQKIPVDPAVRIGELDNGLKYFIRHNNKSEGKAELRLVINAGSVLEEENQRGLAHFLEHMAFNGTTNFEKNELIDYLQNLGVEFGADLNAHTSFDETVYKLTLPTDNQEIFDEGLQIMRDWADGITLSDADIDAERGVVAEELRSGLSAGRRMFNEYVPVITNDSRYAQRLPIGTLDVIMESDYQRIRDFYKDWYRPELMAVIIVGDIEPEQAEKKIKHYFSSLESPENPKERTEFSIPDNKEMTVAIASDEEASGVTFYAYYKKDKDVSQNLAEYRKDLLERLYSSILNQRLDDLRQSGKAPILSGGAGIGSFIGDKEAYFIGGSLKEEQIEEGIAFFLEESERAKRHGITQGELQRHKRKLLNSADLMRKEEGKLSSRYYLEQYIDHFMEGQPIPSDTFQYEFYKEQLPGITVEEVNKIGREWVGEENISVVITAPERDDLKLPTKEDIRKIFTNVEGKTLKPYQDKLQVETLMEKQPAPGEIVSTQYIEEVDVTELDLSNGIKVILKPTDFQSDIVNMSSFRPGGSSLAPDSLYISARNASTLIHDSGVNGISSSEIEKLLMGKTVSVRPYINFYDELVNGSSSASDLETLLQLTHLYFTAPNKSPEAFKVLKERLVANSKNADANPYSYFYRKVAEEMTNNHLRAVPISSAQYEKEFELEETFNFYKERFSNADDFTFIFVGSFDVDSIKPLVEKYLGSLPSEEVDSKWRDIGMRYQAGINKTYYKGMEDKASVMMRFVGPTPFSLEKKQLLDALERLVRLKLYEELREKMGGVYGVRVLGYATDVPYDWYRLDLEFTCSPENVQPLVDAALLELQKIKEEGVSQDDLNKVKEALKLNAEEGLKYNGYWSNKLRNAYEYDLDPRKILEYDAFSKGLTAEALEKAAENYLIEENYSQFVLLPEGEKE